MSYFYLVGSLFFLGSAAWTVYTTVLVRRQDVAKAVYRTRIQLESIAYRRDGLAQVSLWTVRPLSPHMVKEIAAAEGYRYARDGLAQGGAPTMNFAVTGKVRKRKLSIDD